jgi:hypothetical protein
MECRELYGEASLRLGTNVRGAVFLLHVEMGLG